MTHDNRPHPTTIAIRPCKDLNALIEQEHRAVKRKVHPMVGFKSLWAARWTIADSDGRHAIRTGQRATTGAASQTPAEQFHAMAA